MTAVDLFPARGRAKRGLASVHCSVADGVPQVGEAPCDHSDAVGVGDRHECVKLLGAVEAVLGVAHAGPRADAARPRAPAARPHRHCHRRCCPTARSTFPSPPVGRVVRSTAPERSPPAARSQGWPGATAGERAAVVGAGARAAGQRDRYVVVVVVDGVGTCAGCPAGSVVGARLGACGEGVELATRPELFEGARRRAGRRYEGGNRRDDRHENDGDGRPPTPQSAGQGHGPFSRAVGTRVGHPPPATSSPLLVSTPKPKTAPFYPR